MSVKEVLKIKENFPNLSSKKIVEIHKTINNLNKTKPYINITTKRPLQRQIIVLMKNGNISKVTLSVDNHILNINKNLKSNIMADFVWADHHSLIITINKVISSSDLSTIESYIKNINSLESNDILTIMTQSP